MRYLIVGVLIATALSVAVSLGSRTVAAKADGEMSLRPTWFSHFLVLAQVAALIFILALAGGYGLKGDGDLVPLYLLLLGFSAGLAWCVWFFYMRVVYWNDVGVGLRGRLVRPRFIPWDSVDRTRRTWSGDFLISSGRTKIRYIEYQGGHEELTRLSEAKLKSNLMRSAVQRADTGLE